MEAVLTNPTCDGLLEGAWSERKRVYKLTETGTKTIEAILNADNSLKSLTVNVLKIA